MYKNYEDSRKLEALLNEARNDEAIATALYEITGGVDDETAMLKTQERVFELEGLLAEVQAEEEIAERAFALEYAF